MKVTDNKANLQKTIIIFLFCSVILVLSKDIGFFWDNTLVVSKMGHYMYANGLFVINFPDSFDPGHPPLIAFLHALAWKWLGKNLFVSHLVMIPFLFGNIWQLHNFSCLFFTKRWQQILAVSFVFCDPTILAQAFYVGVELPQMFFFLLATNQLLKKGYLLKCIALLFLSLSSVRGMMLCGGFFFLDLFYHIKILRQVRLFVGRKNITVYLLAALPALIFIFWRVVTKGYFLIHPNSQWSELAHFVTVKEFMFNVTVLLHRFLDFGRIGVVFFIAYAFFKKHKGTNGDNHFYLLLTSILLSTSLISVCSLFITNTMGHRYFIISFSVLHILCVYLILNFFERKVMLIISLMILLITGNIWQYPQDIAQGWDASLRSLPYFNLRKKAVEYLANNKIPLQKVGTFYPNIYSDEEINLSVNENAFTEYNSTNEYVLYSNIYNQKTSIYKQINSKYNLIKKFENLGIKIELFKKK